jgi:hypothetical protein|tara:strand:+ start:454 stop:615 length:162 start_codon:yes stop_codon:yes gene_type:complete
MTEEIKKLLEDCKDTLEHIVDSEEWETLKGRSSADVLIGQIDWALEKNILDNF